MKNPNLPITGIIPSEEGNICFYADGYSFTLMDSLIEPLRNVEVLPKDSFIWGKTRNGNDIAIYTGLYPAYTYGDGRIESNAYALLESNTDSADDNSYWGIDFVGGTLNKVYKQFLLRGTLDNYDNRRCIQKTVSIDGLTVTIIIDFGIVFGRSNNKNEEAVFVRMLFSEKQPLISVLRHYNVIKDFISFLMFRRNVGFEDIVLISKIENDNVEETDYKPIGNVYIKQSDPLTEKRAFEGILLEEIESVLPSFLTVLYNSKEREYLYADGFLPFNDSTVLRMTDARIREICSALECELGFIEQKNTDENLMALIKRVTAIVKEHRDGDNPLPQKTYDNIFGSIAHWSSATSDRIIALYSQYKHIITHIRPNRFGYMVDDKAIEKFIQYRNDITHGKFRMLNENVARTAFTMMGLVYCCVLKRIGLEEEQIMHLNCLPELLL